MKKFVPVALAATILSASAVPALNVSAKDKKTTITFWHAMTGNNEKVLNKLIKKFNNSQDKYVVKPTAQGNYSTLQQKFLAAAKGKKLPVMAQSAYTSVPEYVKNGLIANLGSYVKADKKAGIKAINKMYPGFKATAKYDGKYYSIPFAKSLRVMLYNQDILDKYNLKAPTSWDDIEKMAPVLAKDGIATVGFDQSFGQELQGLAKAAGVNFVDGSKDNFKVHYNNPKVIAATQLFTGMIAKGEAKTAGADGYGNNNFASGKTAIYFASSAGLPVIQAAMPEGMKWKTAVLPSYEGKTKTLIGGSDLIVANSANKKQKTGAWKFMQFLISKSATTTWAIGTGYLPLTESAVKSDKYQDFLTKNPNWKANADSLPYAFSAPTYPASDPVWSAGVDAIDSIISNGVDPKTALDKLQKDATQLIKDDKDN
jgi:multiple sugar transport system substrate-binding protein